MTSGLAPFVAPGIAAEPPQLVLTARRGGLLPSPPPLSHRMIASQTPEGMHFYWSGELLARPGFGSFDVRVYEGGPGKSPTTDPRYLLPVVWGYLAHHGGALLHGAVYVIDGHFLMALGDSGVGKSTLGRLVADGGGHLSDGGVSGAH